MNRARRGFTLIELLVVVAIIALLISMLLPGLRSAREKAKEAVCASNLQSFGRGFYSYAAANADFLCSGSFDPEISNDRDGPVDKVGWVADLVNGKFAFPAAMLCPSNSARVNQKLAQGPSGMFGRTFTNGDSYTTWDSINDRIARGFNSNYTQAWYMARTEMRPNSPDLNVKRVRNTLGPLSTARMLRVNAAAVPIMGDGGLETADIYRGGLSDLGEQTVKSMSDGPFEPRFAPQDYSDFGPAHGFGQPISGAKESDRIRANVLFGDGHVSVFVDRVRDGEFRIDYDAQNILSQQDVDQRVFDGVITLGRRSDDHMLLR